MVLTEHEFLTNTYLCPYCHSSTDEPEPPLDKTVSLPSWPILAGHEPEPASEWTTCPACGVVLKAKNLATHRELHCTPQASSPKHYRAGEWSGGSSSGSHHSNYSSSSSYRTPPVPNYCARCGRYVHWPTYYNGRPYGSYCIQKVRGW
jgi:hypothetical protein